MRKSIPISIHLKKNSMKKILFVVTASLLFSMNSFSQSNDASVSEKRADVRELRHDKRDLKRDKAERKHEIRTRDHSGIRNSNRDIREDKREIRGDVKELRKDGVKHPSRKAHKRQHRKHNPMPR